MLVRLANVPCIIFSFASPSSKDTRAVLNLYRIETEDVVTASNLFKYCAPHHGLLLFKRHHPLDFTLTEVVQLLSCGALWFERAAAAAAALSEDTSSFPSLQLGQSSTSLHPFLLWNCMPRAGASQFHGHAQVALSQVTYSTVVATAYAMRLREVSTQDNLSLQRRCV